MADPVAIADLQQAHADALRLGVLASLVLRVEPGLLRVLRRQLLPHADPSSELDLWFSDLVRSRSASAIAFEPAALVALRRRLAADPLREPALALVRRYLATAHAYVRSELELTALPLLNPATDDEAIERQLLPLLDDLRAGGDTAMNAARWLLQAAPRWPERVRATGAAWAAMQAASALLGSRTLAAGTAPSQMQPDELLRLGLQAPRHEVGVTLRPGRLDFVALGTDGSAAVEVPAPWPSLTMLLAGEEGPRVVSALAGSGIDLPVTGDVTLRNPDGTGWHIVAQAQAQRADIDTSGALLEARLIEGSLHVRVGRGDDLSAISPTAGREAILVAPWLTTGKVSEMNASMRPQGPWPSDEDRLFWEPLLPLIHAPWIVVDAAPDVAWLPWESLVLPGRAAPWESRAIGLRLLRRGSPAQDRKGLAPSRSPSALVVVSGDDEPVPGGALEEGRKVEQLLRDHSGLEVHLAHMLDAKALTKALLSRAWTVIHWLSPALVPLPPHVSGSRQEFALALGGAQFFSASDLAQLRLSAEVVVLDADRSGFDAGHEDKLRSLGGREHNHPVDVLLSMGTPIVIACGDSYGVDARGDFMARLHGYLQNGLPLYRAAREARYRVAAIPVDAGKAFQIWGHPHHVASYARAKNRDDADVHPLASALMPLRDLGEVGPPMTGVRVGPQVVVTARSSAGQVPFLVAPHDVHPYAFDPPEDSNPVAVGLYSRWADDGAAHARVVPLAAQEPDNRFAATALVVVDGHVRNYEVSCEVALGESRNSMPHRTFRVSPTRRGNALPASAPGAALLVDGQLAGLVVGEDASGGWLACGVEVIAKAIRAAQLRHVGQRLEEHARWLDSGGKDGVRFAADGADLSGYLLRRARLTRASLVGADLRRAALDGANLNEADLRRADLRDADLTGASLAGTQLDGADLSRARLPRGFRPGKSRLRVQVIGAEAGSSTLRSRLDAALREAGFDDVQHDHAADAEPGSLPYQAAIVLWSEKAARSAWIARDIDQIRAQGVPHVLLRTDRSTPPEALSDTMWFEVSPRWASTLGGTPIHPELPRALRALRDRAASRSAGNA